MKIPFIVFLILVSAQLNAQTWSGVTPGKIYYNSGNVGIGDANPGVGLVVKGTDTQQTLGGNIKSAIRITNAYGGGFGRRSELQFALVDNNALLAVIAA